VSLRNMVLKSGTTLGVTGGTDVTFSDDGVTVPGGVHLMVPAVADYRVRPSSTFRFRAPTLQSDGSYTRDKKTCSYTVPVILASGKVVNNVIRVEREVHPEMMAAAALDLNVMAAQMLFDSDSTSFWAAGSIS